jgi:hypothetical protein
MNVNVMANIRPQTWVEERPRKGTGLQTPRVPNLLKPTGHVMHQQV